MKIDPRTTLDELSFMQISMTIPPKTSGSRFNDLFNMRQQYVIDLWISRHIDFLIPCTEILSYANGSYSLTIFGYQWRADAGDDYYRTISRVYRERKSLLSGGSNEHT